MLNKYKPKKLNEIIGQDTKRLENWLKNPKKKALLIHGPSGIGKTISVYALANELGYEILELNSSDFRDKENIRNIIGEASLQKSLFFKKKIILIDEVDGISGREDFGGLKELTKVIQESKHPIILTGNEIFDSKFSTIRKACEVIEFKPVDYLEIFELIKNICNKEKIDFNENGLKSIARKNNGDVRASILDLERSILDKKINDIGDEREYKESIENGLRLVFKSKDVNTLLKAFSKVDLELDEIMMWIDENLSREYNQEDLAKAYEFLSKADVYRRRILRRQYYRLMVYQSALISVGVGLSKDKKRIGVIDYQRPNRILKLWIAKQKNAKRNSIMEKFASKTHCSIKRARKEFDYLKGFLNNKEIIKELSLDEDEIEYLLNFKRF